jgi:glycine cleavage system regulatory protein
MNISIVLSFLADDKPGLVSHLSKIVKDNNGNWLESRLSRLAGKFAGIIRVNIPLKNLSALEAELSKISNNNFKFVTEHLDVEFESEAPNQYQFSMDIVGNDREGIVHDVTQTLAQLNVNVEDMSSEYGEAAMSSEKIFRAKAQLSAPKSLQLNQVQEALEALTNELIIELKKT